MNNKTEELLNNPQIAESLKEEYGITFNIDEYTPYYCREILTESYISEPRRLKTSSTRRTSKKDILKRRKRNKNRKTHRR